LPPWATARATRARIHRRRSGDAVEQRLQRAVLCFTNNIPPA
jgi:hypothetical protein